MPPTRRSRLARAREVEPFDPLSLKSLQEVLRERLERTATESFPPSDFRGAGVYALYYVGDFDLYRPIRDAGSEIPIYVGKAEAGNSSYGEPADANGLQLLDRIRKHAKSVAEAGQTLRLEDFRVRYMPIDDAWVVLAERALLRGYRPVLWNTVMPGFGANEPGTARGNARSIWDTIHPGRPRAGRLCNRRFTLEEMRERVGLAVLAATRTNESDRQAAIEYLDEFKRRPIWRPKKKEEEGPQVVVQDLDRFLTEMDRLGLKIPEHRVVEGELGAEDDPESLSEHNILVAERLELKESVDDTATV